MLPIFRPIAQQSETCRQCSTSAGSRCSKNLREAGHEIKAWFVVETSSEPTQDREHQRTPSRDNNPIRADQTLGVLSAIRKLESLPRVTSALPVSLAQCASVFPLVSETPHAIFCQSTTPRKRTAITAITEMTVSIIDQVRSVCPTDMPKYSITIQNPASLT